MAQFREKRASEKDKKIAVYGLGTETERFLREFTKTIIQRRKLC